MAIPPQPPEQAPSSSGGQAEPVRLNKRMADLGLCSRRQADDWIARGWVHVDGRAAVLGQAVSVQARIEVDRQAHERQRQQVTVLINKPVGFVSGQAEDGYRPAASLIQPGSRWRECSSATRWSPQHLQALAPAGRLDIDSVGLLVLTQDGRIARQLIGEDSQIEKEYLVRPRAQAGPGELAKPGAAAFCVARGSQTADPAHVRASRLGRHGSQAHPHWPVVSRAVASGSVALSATRRNVLSPRHRAPGFSCADLQAQSV
jgi:hypothetical protein